MEKVFVLVDFLRLFCKRTCLSITSFVFRLLFNEKKDISDDVVLITGGGRGIGRALALEFAKQRPQHIILWGRTEDTLKKTALEVREQGVKCSYMVCDVGESEAVYKNYAAVKKMTGPVTILVNNAGIVHGRQIINTSDEEMENTINVNTMAHFWTIKAVLPDMMESNRGHLVSISSVLGLLGMSGVGDYCSSKFASTGLMEALQWEIQDYKNIHMTSVHPYLVENQMFAGLKLRFPWLVPPLNESYVARQTVSAVLKNKKCVIMPRIMQFVLFTKSLLPVDAMLPILQFTGVDRAMAGFQPAPKNLQFMQKTVSIK